MGVPEGGAEGGREGGRGAPTAQTREGVAAWV
jgi:hypothetical protein